MSNNPPRPKAALPIVASVERVPGRQDVAAMIEALFDVLERHQAGPNEGALALMTSFVQGASRILELSSIEDAEQNRESLLAMVDHARRVIDADYVGGVPSALVH